MNNIKILHVTIGITGCGKSTWLDKLYQVPVIETDDVRRDLYGTVNDQSDEKRVFAEVKKRVLYSFHNNDTVYLGATMVQTEHRARYLNAIKEESEYDIRIHGHIFNCDPKISRERITEDLKTKDRSNSLSVIDKQYIEYLETLKVINEETVFENIIYINN